MSSNAPEKPDSENRDRPAFDAAQKRAAAADIARRISAFKRVQDVSHAEPGDVAPMRAEAAAPAPIAPAESPASESVTWEPVAEPSKQPLPRAHPLLRASDLNRTARRRAAAESEPAEPYLGRPTEDSAPYPQIRVESHTELRADPLPHRAEPAFLRAWSDVDAEDDPQDAPILVEPVPAPPRRRFRPVRFAAIAATLGAAAGALMLWQFGLGENARQIMLTTAAQIAPGETVETPAPAPQAVTVTARPATVTQPAVMPAPIAAPAIASAPEVKPDIAAAPTPGSDPAEPRQPAEAIAAAPTDAPTNSPEPPPAFVAQPFEPNVLIPPANALPPMPSAASIAAAPISIPPTPTDSPAISQPMASAAPQSFSAAPSAAKPAPRVVAQLKPAAKAAAAQPGAKPFVPTAKATKPKPVSKPAAKPFKPAPGPLDQVLDFFAPLTSNGKAPPVPTGNRK